MEMQSHRRRTPSVDASSEKSSLENDFGSEFESVRRSTVMVDARHLLSRDTQTKTMCIPLTRVVDDSAIYVHVHGSSPDTTPAKRSSNITSMGNRDTVTSPNFNLRKLPTLVRGVDNIPRSISKESSPQALKLPKLIKLQDDTVSSRAPEFKPLMRVPIIPMNLIQSRNIPVEKEKKSIPIIPINAKRSTPIIPINKLSIPIIPINTLERSRIPIIPINKRKQTSGLSTPTVKLGNRSVDEYDVGSVKKIKLFRTNPVKQTQAKVESDSDDDVFFDASDRIFVKQEYDDSRDVLKSTHTQSLFVGESDDSDDDSIDILDIDEFAGQPKIGKVNLDGEIEEMNGGQKEDESEEQNDRNDDTSNNHNNSNNNEDKDGKEDDDNIEDNIDTEEKERISDMEVSGIKSKLFVKLTGFSNEGPYGLDSKVKELYKILSDTVLHGGKNSCFIFGPRSSGKSSALKKAIFKVKSELGNAQDIIQIKLNGMVQNDDKLAIRAVAEQLDSEISRIYGVNLEDLERSEFLSRKSLSLTMSNVLKILDTEVSLHDGTTSKIENPIIFIIDEADVYANQARQTLLYNLFDLVENSRTPISVLCFTSNFTFKDLLEKRVRSRFSQKSIQFQKLDRDDFIQVCKKIIQIDNPQTHYEKQFNENVEELISKSSILRKLIVFNHLTTANLKEFQNHCVFAVSKLSGNQPFFNDTDFERYTENVSKGSLKQIINSLSDLETFLLVSAARVMTKNDFNWCNLNLVYEEYQSQVKARSKEATSSTAGIDTVATTGYKIWSKSSCKHPWETLQSIGLLTAPTTANGASKSQDFSNSTFETKMWHVEITLEELRLVIETDKPVKPWTRL